MYACFLFVEQWLNIQSPSNLNIQNVSMDTVIRAAVVSQAHITTLLGVLGDRTAELSNAGVDAGRLRHAAEQFLDAVQDEFDIAIVKDQIDLESKVQRLAKQVYYQRGKRRKAEASLRDEHADREAGRIQMRWFVRTGLADPCVPTKSLEQFFNEFSMVERKQISGVYISRVRFAFKDLVKSFNRQEVAQMVRDVQVANVEHRLPSLFIKHVHDEASMRVRSYTHTAGDANLTFGSGTLVNRSRCSKIQNNHVILSMQGRRVEWLTELQPLMKKDGPTLATALIQVIVSIVRCATSSASSSTGSQPVRILHCLTGDGIETNANAAKRLGMMNRMIF